jgi:hypothetical protein
MRNRTGGKRKIKSTRKSRSKDRSKTREQLIGGTCWGDIYLDEDLLEDRDPHKWAILWASGTFKWIQKNLRGVFSVKELVRDFPHTAYFARQLVQYADIYGLTFEELRNSEHIQILYRGIHVSQVYPNHDRGFIATSHTLEVAQRFSKGHDTDGIVYEFNVGDHTPILERSLVMIDERLADYLMESEVLLMPGEISIIFCDGAHCQATYRPAVSLLNEYRDITVSRTSLGEMRGGSSIRRLSFAIPASRKSVHRPLLELRGKIVVYWRAIVHRKIDILGYHRIPDGSDEEAYEFMRSVVQRAEQSYEHSLERIPEYQDLVKKVGRSPDETRRMTSYRVFTMLVDPATKEVVTPHLGLSSSLFRESQDIMRLDEARQAALEWCARWGLVKGSRL